MRVVKSAAGRTLTVPNGMDRQFCQPPREQRIIGRYSDDRPFRILYVSIIDVYKHQWRVAEAVAQLRASGLPVVLDLVGPAYAPALKRLSRTLGRIDPAGEFLRYWGRVPYRDLLSHYTQADLFLFASSCENMPIILLEAMAAGLPIACSNRGPMPEVLGDGGVLFDPEDPQDIARALRAMIMSPELRAEKARASFERAQAYSWTRCARDTFPFLSEAARTTDVSPEQRPE
jgi:glycosyltransferase involved in cell wall biosynthesis